MQIIPSTLEQERIKYLRNKEAHEANKKDNCDNFLDAKNFMMTSQI